MKTGHNDAIPTVQKSFDVIYILSVFFHSLCQFINIPISTHYIVYRYTVDIKTHIQDRQKRLDIVAQRDIVGNCS